MANKIVAVFLMCIVLAAAISVQARIVPNENTESPYRECFVTCQKNCPRLEGQYTDCEMKCDSKCAAEEFAAKLHIKA